MVSIHAPARGATLLAAICSAADRRFNPRTRTGCDDYQIIAADWVRGFNPRTRTGCDTVEYLSPDF